MEATETSFNEMQTLKRRFFAMRNGVIADVLRKAGSPHRIIFGLNLPQIAEIAASYNKSNDLAERLWANTTTRESMLIAPMLADRDKFDESDARRWLGSAPSYEVIDVLCLKLLRYCDFAIPLAESLRQSDRQLDRYAGLRLMFNLVGSQTEKAQAYAENAIASESDASLKNLATSLLEECRWLMME